MLLLYIFLFISSFIFGYIFPNSSISNDNSKKDGIISLICYGFAYHIAIFEVLFLPFYFIKTTFNTVVTAYIIVLFISTIIFVIKLKKEENLGTRIKKFFMTDLITNIKEEFSIPLILCILFITFQIFIASYMTHTDADDGYMTTVSTIAYLENKINLSFWGVYDGIDVEGGRASIFCWEFFIAALAKIFGIHPAILNHSVIIGFLLIISYMAVYLIYDMLFTKKRRNTVLFLYSVLITFSAYSTYSLGCRMLLRIWQGKNTMVGFLLPLFLHSVLKIYYGDSSWKRYIINVILVISGIGMTVIGIYFIPLTYAIFGLPLLLFLLFKKDFQRLGDTLKKLIVSVIPILAVMVIAFINSIGKEEDGANIGQTTPDWMFTFTKTFGDSYILYLFIVSILVLVAEYIIVNRTKKDTETAHLEITSALIRLVFVAIPMLMALTLLNPLLCNFISYNITSVPVYWRLYWIIPIQLTIAIALSYPVCCIKNEAIHYIGLVIVCVISALSGTYMFQKDTQFTDHINYYMIPNEVIKSADIMTKEEGYTTAAFPAEISYYVRQYDSRISVVGSRSFQNGARMIGDTDKNYAWLYDMIYINYALDDPEVISSLNILDVRYVFIYGDYIETENYSTIEIPGYGYLYKLNN